MTFLGGLLVGIVITIIAIEAGFPYLIAAVLSIVMTAGVMLLIGGLAR